MMSWYSLSWNWIFVGQTSLGFIQHCLRWWPSTIGLLPDTQICGCACAGNAGNVFPVTAGKRSRHASRHVRDARAVIANQRFPLKSAAGENVPGIPGACATCNFTYLVRGPCSGLGTGTCRVICMNMVNNHEMKTSPLRDNWLISWRTWTRFSISFNCCTSNVTSVINQHVGYLSSCAAARGFV